MDLESLNGLMEDSIKENGPMESSMEREFIQVKKELKGRANGSTV